MTTGENRRLQLALFTTNKDMFDRLLVLAGQIDCDTHMARLADVPLDLNDNSVQENTQRMLRGYELPFAIIAVTGTDEEIRHATKVLLAARKRVPTMLVTCPDGYRYMCETIDVPFFAKGYPPHSYNVVGAVLLGSENEFPNYDDTRFGDPTHLQAKNWQKANLEYLAEYVRRVAKPARDGHALC